MAVPLASGGASEARDASALRRGVKRPASEETNAENDLLLLSPSVGAQGLDAKQADELAGLMMEMALSRSRGPVSSASAVRESSQRSAPLSLGALASATAAAYSSLSSSLSGSISLNCPLCRRFYHQPVTASCGHTFCLQCLHSRSSASEGSSSSLPCTVLGCRHLLSVDDPHINMPLAGLLRKWFPQQSECLSKWHEGEKLMEEDKLESSVEALSDAISLDSENWELRSSRSRAFFQLNRMQACLADARKMCQVCPTHSELIDAYLYRARLELRVGVVYDSVVTVLHSVILSGSTNKDAGQLLASILIQLSSNMVKERPSSALDGELGRRLNPLIDKSVGAARKKTCNPPQSSLFSDPVATNPSPSDVECPICGRLTYKPVTTSCGHMFCQACLEQALDHRQTCPCCRTELGHRHADQPQAVTEVAEKLLETFLSEDYTKRKEEYEDEIRVLKGLNSATCNIPIFICQLTMPGIACPLRIHEPRYRLMLRRCLQSGTRQFGMCMPGFTADSPLYADQGTLLEIKDVSFAEDGSSTLQTVGSRRFKVLDRNMRDGYSVSNVEWIDDKPVEDATQIAELKTLQDEVYKMAEQFLNCPMLARLKNVYGALPAKPADPQENTSFGPDWHWHCLNMLPLAEDRKKDCLASTSLKERLEILRSVLSAYSNPSAVYAFLMYHCLRRG